VNQQDQDYEATEPSSAAEDEYAEMPEPGLAMSARYQAGSAGAAEPQSDEDEFPDPDVIIAEGIDTDPDRTMPAEGTDQSMGVPLPRHGTAGAFATAGTQPGGPGEISGTEDPGTESARTVAADPAAAEPVQPYFSEELNREWREIQASFVDDPRGAVQLAAEAADTALTALVTSLRERQSGLGPTAGQDTEQLRAALQGYRKFCQAISEVGHTLPQSAPSR
jgi:hypothetical protein